MTTEFLKTHADTLRQFANETSEEANKNPGDFWLRVAVKNQMQAAHEAEQYLKIAYAEEVGETMRTAKPNRLSPPSNY